MADAGHKAHAYGVGKHLVTWEKQGGQWKVTAEAISSDSATGTPVR